MGILVGMTSTARGKERKKNGEAVSWRDDFVRKYFGFTCFLALTTLVRPCKYLR